VAALVVPLSGCGDDEDGNGPAGCYDYGSVDTQVCGGGLCSFATDVIPIFQVSCSLSGSCHSNRVATPNGEGLVLGPPATEMGSPVMATPMEIAEVHAAILDVASVRSELPLVVPGDPGGSWLMAKAEYEDIGDWGSSGVAVCQAVYDACLDTAKGCGVMMPQTGPKLEEERLAILRAWIAGGAPNN
jgi:hypothetical protein